MSILGAVPLALLGLALAQAGWETWSPLAGVVCGYAAGLLTRFDVQIAKGDPKSDH